MAENKLKNEELSYCPGCGDMVSTYSVERDGVVELRCAYCGLILETAIFERSIKVKENIFVVDDSELIQVMLKDALKENKIAKNIILASNGSDFLSKIVDCFLQRVPIDLVVLDIQMPIMSGINAAVALRAIEKGFKRDDKKAPILFFSVKRCDENLQKVMQFCDPAKYINKGVSGSKEEMFERVRKVVTQLMES